MSDHVTLDHLENLVRKALVEAIQTSTGKLIAAGDDLYQWCSDFDGVEPAGEIRSAWQYAKTRLTGGFERAIEIQAMVTTTTLQVVRLLGILPDIYMPTPVNGDEVAGRLAGTRVDSLVRAGVAALVQEECDRRDRDWRERTETYRVVIHARGMGIEERKAELARVVADRGRIFAEKQAAYVERDKCVALIARLADALGYPVGLARHGGGEWDDDWRTVVYIDLPSGQVSWHIHDSERAWFSWAEAYDGEWDGHDTEEKYRRVLAYEPEADGGLPFREGPP